jgi:hypothetical protein
MAAIARVCACGGSIPASSGRRGPAAASLEPRTPLADDGAHQKLKLRDPVQGVVLTHQTGLFETR